MPGPHSLAVPVVVVAGVGAVLLAGAALMMRADSKVNKTALASAPKPVTVVSAREASFRETRTYVGTLRPWIEANVGPQFISAYVDTVLVRPGASVKRNEVLATLDCRNASASSQFVVEGDVAHKKTFATLGEQGSDLYIETTLAPGTQVVTEGRASLTDGDHVAPKESSGVATISTAGPAAPVKGEVKP